MAQLKYIKGDLFTTDCNVIAHGCNTRGAFNSGVAGQIRRLYPKVREAYLEKYELYGWELGQIQFVPINKDVNPLWIVNMSTQDTYGKTGVHVNYDAVRQCFKSLFRHCEYNDHRIAIPKIGAGLAGGDWGRIEKILLDLLFGTKIELSVYTLE